MPELPRNFGACSPRVGCALRGPHARCAHERGAGDASRDRALQALERMDKAVFRDGYATAAKAPASSFDPEDAAKAKKSKRPSGARDDDDADDGD